MQYAGFWRRAVAAVVDMLLSAPFYMAIQAMFGARDWVGESLFLIGFSAAYVWLFASRWQASPGMRIMGVRIVDTQGKRITLVRSFVWTLTSFIGLAIAFGALFWIQTKVDLSQLNALLMEVQNSAEYHTPDKRDPARIMAEIEALVGMPFADFYGTLLAALLVTVVLNIMWMFTVALGYQKAGLHNRICGTRMIRF